MGGRERMLSEGPGFLSDEELIAVLVGSGTQAHSASEVAARLLRGGLAALRRARFSALIELPGVGEAQACRLLAAFELGRRAMSLPPADRRRLWNAGVVARRLFPRLAWLGHEEFWVLLLNTKLEELRAVRVSAGGLSHCSVLPREALAPALVFGATVCLFAHNHPSGDPTPSAEDRRLQLTLDESARLLGLRVADHVILAERGMHSVREGGFSPPPSPADLDDETEDARDDGCGVYDACLDGLGDEGGAGELGRDGWGGWPAGFVPDAERDPAAVAGPGGRDGR